MFHVRRLITKTNSFSPLLKFPLNQANFYSNTAEQANSAINLSDSCVKRLKELYTNSNQYLRILVDSGGCSGLEYKFSLDANITPEDKVIEKEGVKVLVDKETLDYIKGSTIDYYEELIRAGFRVINNPNSEQGCSCGSSFSIKI